LKPIKIMQFTPWATVHVNEKFMAVTPLSGYRLRFPEDENHAIYLEPDATQRVLGQALLKTLDRSRFVDPSDGAFF